MLQKFKYKAEAMTMQTRKCGARIALYPPGPHSWATVSHSPLWMPHAAVLSRDAIPSSQLSPLLCKQIQQSQLCKELNWKSSMHINFFSRLILTQSFVQGTHHIKECASTQRQCRDRVCLFNSFSSKAETRLFYSHSCY